MRSRGKKIGLTALLVAPILLVLSGCGEAADNSSTKTTSSSQTVTLTMWAVNAANFDKPHQEIIQKFEQENPNIKIQLETMPDAEYPTKLASASVSGTLPDIMEAKTFWAVPYMASGALEPVPSSIGTTAQLNSDYFSGPLGESSYHGTIYGVPANFSTEAAPLIAYDKDIFQKNGASPPWNTWDSFVSSLQKVTQKDSSGRITMAGMEISPGPDNYEFFGMLLHDFGGSFLNSAGTQFTFDSPAGEQALQLMVQLENKDGIDAPYVGHGKSSEIGTAEATSFGGPWLLALVNKQNPAIASQIGYAAMPMPSGSTAKTPGFYTYDGWGWYVFQSSKNLAAANKFLQFLSQPENEQVWAEGAGEIPARKSVATSDSYLQANPAAKSWLPYLNDAMPLPFVGDITQFENILSNMIESAVLNKQSVSDALKSAQDQENAMLQKYLQTTN